MQQEYDAFVWLSFTSQSMPQSNVGLLIATPTWQLQQQRNIYITHTKIFCVHTCVHMYFVLCVYVHFIAVFVAVATRLTLTIARCALRAACCVLRTAREASPPSSLSRVRVRAGSQTSWTDQPAGHVNSGNNNNNDKERLPSVKVNMQKGRGRDKVRMERERGAGREREGEQVKCWQLRNVSFKDVSPVRAGMTYRFEAWEFSRPARKRWRKREKDSAAKWEQSIL